MGNRVALIAIAETTAAVTNSTVSVLSDFGFTDAEIGAADEMHITVYDSDCAYTYSGLNPTTSGVGHYVAQDTDRVIAGNPNIRKFRIIGITTTSNLFITLSGSRVP